MSDYGVKIEQIDADKNEYDFYAIKLAEKYFDESVSTSTFYKKYNKLLKVYSSLAKIRVKEMRENNYPIFEILLVDSEKNILIGSGYFTIAPVGNGLHIPEILFENSNLEQSVKALISAEVLKFLDEYALSKKVENISAEYHDEDALYQEVILDMGFSFYFDDDDYNTNSHIAYKNILKKEEEDARDSSSKQKIRCN